MYNIYCIIIQIPDINEVEYDHVTIVENMKLWLALCMVLCRWLIGGP